MTPNSLLFSLLVKNNQFDKFQAMKLKEFSLTRFLGDTILAVWGTKGDVYNIANGLKLRKVLTTQKGTYKCLILEFLSSLEIVGEERLACSTRAGAILHFRPGNGARILDIVDFANIFGLKIKQSTTPESSFIRAQCWARISGSSIYNATNANDSLIHQPTIRYLRKF